MLLNFNTLGIDRSTMLEIYGTERWPFCHEWTSSGKPNIFSCLGWKYITIITGLKCRTLMLASKGFIANWVMYILKKLFQVVKYQMLSKLLHSWTCYSTCNRHPEKEDVKLQSADRHDPSYLVWTWGPWKIHLQGFQVYFNSREKEKTIKKFFFYSRPYYYSRVTPED